MTLPLLLDDALETTGSGFVLRLSLPWIRSMPLAAVTDLEVRVDGSAVPVTADVGGRGIAPGSLAGEPGWWFIQDRLELHGDQLLPPGERDVAVSMMLHVPYLPAGPDAPLVLRFHEEHSIAPVAPDAPADTVPRRAAAASVTERRKEPTAENGDWTLSASAFNWTREVIGAERSAADIAIGIVTDDIAPTIEIEPGQMWRSFPETAAAEVDAFRARLAAAGGDVTIVGASLDDWSSPTRRRTEKERLTFLAPQLRAAARLGARGVRVPFGQAGPDLLRLAQPLLDELDVALYEEIQGPQSLDAPGTAANLALLHDLDDPHLRVLIDISMLMPSLPPSYLDALRRAGVDAALITRLEQDWQSSETQTAVRGALRGGQVPAAAHMLFMNLLVRFGRSQIADLEPLLPLTGAVHLKFWDLDDGDDRISGPIRDIGTALRRRGFTGSLTSEWGGHEWLEADAATMTRSHLALARRALSDPAQPSPL